MDRIRLLLYLFASRVCLWLRTQACIGQRRAFYSQLSPPTFPWALGIKLSFLGLGSEPFTQLLTSVCGLRMAFHSLNLPKDAGVMNGAQQQIYKMLAEILGGHRCVKASTLSPYYHTVGKSPDTAGSFRTRLTRIIF